MSHMLKRGERVKIVNFKNSYMQRWGFDECTVGFVDEDMGPSEREGGGELTAVRFVDGDGRGIVAMWVMRSDIEPIDREKTNEPNVTRVERPISTPVATVVPDCKCAAWWAFWNPCSRFGWITYMIGGACVPLILQSL